MKKLIARMLWLRTTGLIVRLYNLIQWIEDTISGPLVRAAFASDAEFVAFTRRHP